MKRKCSCPLADESSESSLTSMHSSVETVPNDKIIVRKLKNRSSVIKQVLGKYKLRDKSLSKGIGLPLNKKISRSCTPFKVRKVCKIKKKPTEKKKEKPSPKSLRRKKFSNPRLFNKKKKKKKKEIPDTISESDPEILSEDVEIEKFLKKIQGSGVYDPVTPQMLVEVLQYPLLLRFGATIDMIIRKLRNQEKSLQPSVKILKEEVKKKLDCAEKLGIVEEDSGHYWITDVCKLGKLSPRKIDAFWHLYSKKWMMKGCAKSRKNTSKYLPIPN